MKNILLLVLLVSGIITHAQNNVGIGTNTPHNSAKLEISDSTKGILIPRMNSNQRNAIVSPANGLLVYDNDSLAFMYFNGSVWKKMATSFSLTESDPQVSSTSSNQVPKWDGTTLVDGIITDDGTKLGIGTTTPDIDTKVDILSDKPAGIRLLSGNTANTTYFTFGRVTQEGVLGTASHPNNYVTGSQAGDIVLREENSANAVIINSGYGNADLIVKGDNVGIGTVSPSNTLDVAGTTETDLFKMNTGAGAGKILQSDASGNASWVVLDTTKGSTLDKAYDFGGRGNGRIIIADSGAVRINGQDGFIVTGTLGTGDIIETIGAGTRMFFNPNKGAFRSGTVNSSYWDNSLIGQNSFATGNNTTAQGLNSFSFGNQTYSSGDNSIAGGFNSAATNNNSIAIGYNSTASGNTSIAIGESVTASGDNSIAMGRSNSASTNYTTNLGGISNSVSGLGSTNIGGQGNHSTSFMSVTMGESNTASGGRSMATNYSNIASGENSSSMGYSNTAKSSGEMVVGIGATNYTPSINGNTFFQAANANDRLFVIGNAIDSNANNQVDINERSNAFVVLKNGNTAIGNITPTSKLDVNGKTKTINFQMTNGAGANKILQSDVSGNASWVNPPSYTDTDSQSLSLSGNNLTISRGNTLDMSSLNANNWKTTGNTGTNADTNFIGTTDSVDLVFKNNNNQNMRLFANGSWLVGDSMQGAGSKVFFNKTKQAFRIGTLEYSGVRNWDTDSLGIGSISIGINTKTKGHYALSTGFNTAAIGDFSTTTGANTTAYGRMSMTMNINTSTKAWYSTAMGVGTIANGFGSLVLGQYNDTIIANQEDLVSLSTPLFTIGNGEYGSPSNAMVVRFDSKIGLGHITPASHLHQDMGTSTATYHKFTANITTGRTSTDGFDIGINATGIAELRQRENLNLNLFTNDIQRMTIENGGQVGINTSTPISQLHVVGNLGSTGITPASDAQFVLDESSDDLYMSILTDTNQESGYQFGNQFSGSHAGIYYNSGGNTYDMRFRVNGNSTKMTIDKDGQVGIGTTTPNSDLETTGSFATAINTTSSNITLNENHHTVILTSGTPTVTLPLASTCARRIYVIVNQTINTRTITSYLGFSGLANNTIVANSSITIQSDGTNWYRIQ